MKDYKRGSHTIWDCKYHLVWVTKYRYAVLVGDVGLRCRELLREIARSQEMNHLRGQSTGTMCPPSDWRSAAAIGIEGGAIPEG